MNGFALENAFARRNTKNGLLMRAMVAVNRGFHGGKPRGEPSLKRPIDLTKKWSDKKGGNSDFIKRCILSDEPIQYPTERALSGD